MSRAETGYSRVEQMERLLGITTEMLSGYVSSLDRSDQKEGKPITADVAKLTTAIAQFVRSSVMVAAPRGERDPIIPDDELDAIFAELDAEQGLR
jgi:hypothetical protein